MKEDINFYKFIFTEPREILYIDKNKIENETIFFPLFQQYLKSAVDRVIKVDHKYQLDLKLYLLFLNSDKNIEELKKEKNINLFHLLDVIKLYNIFDNDSMEKIILKIADRINASIIANQFEDYYLKTVDLHFHFMKKTQIYEFMKNNFEIFISMHDVISLDESQQKYLFELIYSKLVFNQNIASNNSIGFGVAVGYYNIVKLINVIEYAEKKFLEKFRNRFFSLSITTNKDEKYVSGNYFFRKRGELTDINIRLYNLDWKSFSLSDISQLEILFE